MSAAFMALLGSMILLPLYLQNLRGLTPLETGLLVMPGGLAMGLLGPQVGKLYDRFGSRPLVIPGCDRHGRGARSRSAAIDMDTPYWLILAVHVALMVEPRGDLHAGLHARPRRLPQHLYSHGSSLLGTLQQVAGAVGTALVVDHEDPSGAPGSRRRATAEAFVGGLQWAFVVGAVMGVVVVLRRCCCRPRAAGPAAVDGAPTWTPSSRS